jgi:hypothetical protein
VGNTYSPSNPLKLSDLQLAFEQKTATSDDKNSKYTFTIDGKGKVLPTMIVVSLLWYDKEKGGGGEFAVTTGPEKSGKKIPIYLVSCVSNLYPGECHPWKPNKSRDGFESDVNFVYGDGSLKSLFYLVTNEELYPGSPSRSTYAGDAAFVYYNSYKAIKYFESLKGQVTMNLNPVIVDVYDSVTSKYCIDEKTKADIDNAFYDYRNVKNIGGLGKYLDAVQGKGGTVSICKLTSSKKQWDAPANREYHELGHYLQHDFYYPGIPLIPDRGKPHAGYENSSTNDSVVEAFASFVALLIKEHYQGGTGTKFVPLYPGGFGSTNEEDDIKVWGNHVILKRDPSGKIIAIHRPDTGKQDDEEDAIDGILWDLHDNTKEPTRSKLSTLYTTSKDQVSLPDSKILMIISNFKPMDLVQLYDAFETIVPKASLDMIFINHGAFGDTLVHNLVHESPDELPGYTGDTRVNPDRTHRTKVPTIPGSYIAVEKDATFNISMIHDPPNSDYDYSIVGNMTKGESIYFKMSPPYYPSKAVFDQVSLNGNKTLAKNVLVIDSGEYWSYIESSPDEKQVFKTVPVPVSVPSFPVDQLRNSNTNTTGLKNDNGTNNEINNESIIQQSNVYPSIIQNNSNLSPSSNLSLPLIQTNNISLEVSPSQRTTGNLTFTHYISLPSTNETFTAGIASSDSNPNATYVTIDLLPNSSPLFYKCDETTVNGSSTLPGLNVTDSLIQALTDANPDTQILGNITIDINFQKPFTDKPGRDLIIYEIGNNTESLNIMTLINESASGSPVNFVGYPTGDTDGCGNPINTIQLDLVQIGIPAGSAISGLRINNDPDNNGGAYTSDIAVPIFGIP